MNTVARAISANDLLSNYTHASLQQMARKRGIDVKSQNKSALVQNLARKLYDPEAIMRAQEDLEPVERDALHTLILMGGAAPAGALRQQLIADGRVKTQPRDPYGSYYHRPQGSASVRGSDKFEDIVARLGVVGLVFSASGGAYKKNVDLAEPGLYLFIPNAILEHLPAISLSLETSPPPASEVPANADVLLRDIYLLASVARKGPIALTVRGLIPKRTLVQIDESLRWREEATGVGSESELGRLPLLRALEEDLGLLTAGPDGLRLGSSTAQFLAQPRGTRLRQLYDAYHKTQRWSELSRLQDITISPRDRINGPKVASARKRVLEEIAGLPAGEWIAVAHLVDRLRRRAFDFLLPREWKYDYYSYGSYYGEPNPYSGNNPMGLTFYRKQNYGASVRWEEVEGGFIRTVALEALHWLGMVDLGVVEGEDGSVFRVTVEGNLLLHGQTPASDVPAPHVIIQPNFQIFAFEPTDEDVLFTLDRLAERVRAEQVMEYRLTRESVYGAQREGMELGDILSFLEQVSQTPLPQNVRRSLEEWGAQHERIVVRRNASVLHAIDEPTLDALYAEPEVSRLLGRRLGPTAAILPAAHLQTVYTCLLAQRSPPRHPLPSLSEGNDAWKAGALVTDATGRLTFRQRLPSIHVKRALRPFTEEDDNGTMWLTPESLRRAAGNRRSHPPLTADEMIATLERLHTGPLPDEVATLVRRWAKDWGKGVLTDVALLQVESPEILADLLADTEVKRYLQPVRGASTLATVSRDHADEVRRLLHERGMQLSTRL